jgi:hypothetical protein
MSSSFVWWNLSLPFVGRQAPSLQINMSSGTWEGYPSGKLGTLSQWQGDENTAFWVPDKCPRNVVGCLRERDKAPKLSGSKFIKKVSNDSADLSPQTDLREQRRLSYKPFGAGYRYGGATCPIPGHILFHWLFSLLGRGDPSLLSCQVLLDTPQIHLLCFTVTLIISHYLWHSLSLCAFPSLLSYHLMR